MSLTETHRNISRSSWSTASIGKLLLERAAWSAHTAYGRSVTTRTASGDHRARHDAGACVAPTSIPQSIAEPQSP